MNPTVSDKLRQVMEAGINPEDAGYGDIDLHNHFSAEDLKPREQQTPDANKVAKARRTRRTALRKLYNSFENRDMSFEAFCKEFDTLSNPALLQKDARMLAMQKHRGNRNKSRIDAALRN